VERLGHLREADAFDVRERVEQLRQWEPRDRARGAGQRGLGVDRSEGAFDLAAPFEDRRNLSRRDAGAAAVREPEVTLVE
jgi:hypothetical protein